MAVKITGIVPHSAADKAGLTVGDTVYSINGNEIVDVLDYRFYMNERKLRVEYERSGQIKTATVRKGEYDDPGLEFETYLMDKQHSCKNKCIFCFIDQLPQGMRESLYFKDDDSRLSFLFGNYITLTNLTEREVDRMIKMHISPINISVHTTNPELRVKMMKNRFAGESLSALYKLAAVGTSINCQLVICPGYNDGDELRRTLNDLCGLCPSVQSIAIVPLGMTRFREGLEKLTPFTPQTAADVIDTVEQYGSMMLEKYGSRVVFASDELYIEAGRPLPDAEFYEDFCQLENGVGMCALLKDEIKSAVEQYDGDDKVRRISIATGYAAYPLMCEIVDIVKNKWHNLECQVYRIRNDFFGHSITVAGLLTAQDIIAGLKGKPLGDRLLVSDNMFKADEDITLDDMHIDELSAQLGVPVSAVRSDGYELLDAMINYM